jgi:hypothetical protein
MKMYFTEGVIYEIVKYLDGKDYLNCRLIWNIGVIEPEFDDNQITANWLTLKGFSGHKVALKWSPWPIDLEYSAEHSYLYANDVIKGPWLAGEAIILTNAYYSYLYANDVIKGPWLAGEAIILTNAYYSYHYAMDVIKGPWIAGEATIATNACYSYYYTRNVIKGPWSTGEATIATNACYSYIYAKDVIKGPWSAGEVIIMTSNYKDRYIELCKID